MEISIITFSYPNDGRKLKRLVQGVVQGGFAACIQIMNYVHSYYIREGKLKKAQEKLVVCKTSVDKKDKLIEFVKKQHPYEIPDILAETKECNEEFGKWAIEQTEKKSKH